MIKYQFSKKQMCTPSPSMDTILTCILLSENGVWHNMVVYKELLIM